MAKNNFSVEISVFQGRTAPEKALLVGYGAIINALNLALPLPEILALISYKRKQYRTEGWKVYPSKAGFEDTLYQHLNFCIEINTIQNIIPTEISYLQKHDEFKRYLEENFEMPNNLIATLVQFLEQNNGKFSKRAKDKEFAALTEREILKIEDRFQKIFDNQINNFCKMFIGGLFMVSKMDFTPR